MTFRAQGMRAWLLQRLSAIYLAAYFVVCLVVWFCTDPLSYSEWRQFVAHPVINVSIGLFFAALLIHAWVGIRDVLVDYVSHAGIRVVILLAIAFSLIALGFWVLLILVSVVKI